MVAVGEVFVWPHHGPVRVEATEIRDVAGVTTEHVVLSPVDGGAGGLALVIPADKLDSLGARPIADKKTVNAVLDGLGDGPTPVGKRPWAAKYKAMCERAATGQLEAHGENLRDMLARFIARELSPAEKRLWDQTLTRFSSEAAIASGSDTETMTASIMSKLGVTQNA